MLKNLLSAVFILVVMSETQGQEYVKVKDNQFYLNGSEFNFLGFNAYYLLTETAFGRNYITDEVFDAANETGAKVVRTWAFYEADGQINPAVIRPSPYAYNEESLQALDYVIYKAKEKNIRVILTLLNSNHHYGGIQQYLMWGKKYLNKDFSRNGFFINDTLKAWYKDYMSVLLNRVNIYTSVAYKDEPAIFGFELINEGTNQFSRAGVIYNWYAEMAAHFKSIDNNHLLTTGEGGEDDDRSQYSDVNLFYNSSGFLFDGTKGTSYSRNLSIPQIDYGTFHLYSDGWGFLPAAGVNWIKEHLFIAETYNKPSLLSEFGSRQKKAESYAKWLQEASTLNCRSAIIWQYLHPDVQNTDGYGFNLNDTAIVQSLKYFIDQINLPLETPAIPLNAELFQNYPNPFNPVTTIKYALNTDDNIIVELFNTLGERVGVLDEGFKKRGTYELLLSFNSAIFASGTYFYTLKTSRGQVTRKLILLK